MRLPSRARTVRSVILFLWLAVSSAAPLVAQQVVASPWEGSWWLRALYFVISLPYTLWVVFVEGQRMHLLPAPLLGAAVCVWSFREWRRQRYWTPRIVPIMAILALATIILINLAWVRAGGEMVTQRYVVIALFGIFPYVAYLLFLGPKYVGRKRAPAASEGMPRSLAAVPPTQAAVQTSRRGRSRLVRFYLSLGGLALVLAVLDIAVGSGATEPSSTLLGPEFAALDDPASLVPLARGVEQGSPDAPVTIIEFGDYHCPACAAFSVRYKPEIEDSLIATGRARFVYYDFPLRSDEPSAFLAARAAHCAEDQGRFWEYHEELYRQQDQWSPLDRPEATFERYAGDLGLDTEAFQGCLRSDRHTDLVTANQELARALGMNSTPSMLVKVRGGQTRRSPSYGFYAILGTIEDAMAGGASD